MTTILQLPSIRLGSVWCDSLVLDRRTITCSLLKSSRAYLCDAKPVDVSEKLSRTRNVDLFASCVSEPSQNVCVGGLFISFVCYFVIYYHTRGFKISVQCKILDSIVNVAYIIEIPLNSLLYEQSVLVSLITTEIISFTFYLHLRSFYYNTNLFKPKRSFSIFMSLIFPFKRKFGSEKRISSNR